MAEEKPTVIGITGLSCSGKTTLAKCLCERLDHSLVLHQDDFYKCFPETELQWEGLWEDLSAIDMKSFVKEFNLRLRQPWLYCVECAGGVVEARRHTVVLEGLHLHTTEALTSSIDLLLVLESERNVCRQRREKRLYDGPRDPPDYFDRHVWPAHQSRRQVIESMSANLPVTFLSATQSKADVAAAALKEVSKLSEWQR